jgi:hypothetical protein
VQQLPTFARTSQNVAIAVTLMDMLPTPSTNVVGKVYQRLKNIFNTAATPQAESSVQQWIEASISTLDCSMAGGNGPPKKLQRLE